MKNITAFCSTIPIIVIDLQADITLPLLMSHAGGQTGQRFHVGLEPPVVFDCRMKPWYTDVLEVDPATKALVDEKISSIIPLRYR
ncbi:hypothetical protein [Desulfogranum marinum]|uniref:hypothetical protein n=1 Tax=Desulfogranum marinum TaxID=453220 RepID=UPI0029C802EF|nr:hypothetical protein [Desulfogranum marinum]